MPLNGRTIPNILSICYMEITHVGECMINNKCGYKHYNQTTTLRVYRSYSPAKRALLMDRHTDVVLPSDLSTLGLRLMQ